MIILVDGYNVLKLVYGALHVGQSIRDKFLKQLAAYGKRKGHTLVLVFDGGPYAMSTEERHGQAIVVYAGYRETADDYIKRYIDNHPNRELLLVTNDRELSRHAIAADVPTIDVWPFYERVLHREQEREPSRHGVHKTSAHKLHPDESNPELDAMLEQADILEKVEHEPSITRKNGRHTQSKQERALEALLKKL